MHIKGSFRLKWFVRIAIFSGIVWYGWALFGLHVNEPGGFITPSKAESITGLKLPSEAKNIRAASYNQWIQYAAYLRFEAPVDICLQFASTIVPEETFEPADKYALANGAFLTRPDAFDDFAWFDLGTAKNVVTAGGGPGLPQVWIDQEGGVFYYRKTD